MSIGVLGCGKGFLVGGLFPGGVPGEEIDAFMAASLAILFKYLAGRGQGLRFNWVPDLQIVLQWTIVPENEAALGIFGEFSAHNFLISPILFML